MPNGSRAGFGINMFCMSLMKEENRKAFKANEAEYLKKFKLTPEQTDAVLKRDYNRMLELGGNIYFTAKLGATDGHSFQHLAAVMTGATQPDYAKMMLNGGRSVEGNRSRSGKNAPSKPRGCARAAEAEGKVRQSQDATAKADKPSARPSKGPNRGRQMPRQARPKPRPANPNAKSKSQQNGSETWPGSSQA